MERTVIRLQALVEQRFDSQDRRLDQIIGRLDFMNGKVGKAHERASKLEAHMRDLQARVEKIATRVHEFADSFHARVEMAVQRFLPKEKATEHGDADRDQITVSRLKWYLACVAGGASLMLWVLKLMGWGPGA